METNRIPSYWHNCATCTRWCGWTSTDFFRRWVEYETHGTGRCAGGRFNGLDMPGLSSCPDWERRFK